MRYRKTPISRFAIPALLIAGLGGLAVLTRLSFQAHQRQQDTARTLISGLATRVADRFGTDLQGSLYIGSTALLNRAGLGRMGTRPARGAAAAILAAVPDVARCRCAPPLRLRYAFTANLRSGAIEVVAAESALVAPPPPLPLLREEMAKRAGIGGWEFAIALQRAPGGVLLFFTRVASESDAIAGFAVDTNEVRYRLIQEVDSRRAALLVESGLTAGDSGSLSVRIQLPDSFLLANLRPATTGAITGSSLLPRIFGGWRITAGLREGVAANVLGTGAARSPIVLMVVLAGLAAVALLVAWAAARRAAELASLRANLITGISHELRTPLTEILLVGESIQRGQYRGETEVAGAVDVVVREAHRLLGMISNVLHISVTGTAAPRHAVPQRIGDEVRRVIDDFAGIATGYGCTVEFQGDDDPLVAVDLEAIRQILNNFLDNACRYGGPGQRIVVELRRYNGALRLAVRDQGPGIPHEHREVIWRPFTRGPQRGGQERFGSGIGLAVARQLATSMQGRTGVAEGEAEGAVVYVEFDLVEEPA